MPATVWGARVTVWAETADRPRNAQSAIRDKGRRRTAIFPDKTKASSRCDGGDSVSFAAGRIARDEPMIILSRLPRIGTCGPLGIGGVCHGEPKDARCRTLRRSPRDTGNEPSVYG